MNGYSVIANSYRRMDEKGEIPHEEAEKKVKLYDFLSTCDLDDYYTLFDSAAFNEIAKGYLRIAVQNLAGRGIIDEEQGKAIRREFAFLFSEKTAKEVC